MPSKKPKLKEHKETKNVGGKTLLLIWTKNNLKQCTLNKLFQMFGFSLPFHSVNDFPLLDPWHGSKNQQYTQKGRLVQAEVGQDDNSGDYRDH